MASDWPFFQVEFSDERFEPLELPRGQRDPSRAGQRTVGLDVSTLSPSVDGHVDAGGVALRHSSDPYWSCEYYFDVFYAT